MLILIFSIFSGLIVGSRQQNEFKIGKNLCVFVVFVGIDHSTDH